MEEDNEVRELSLPERIVFIVFAPLLFIGGWPGWNRGYIDVTDVMFFFFPAILFFLCGVSRRAYEWGLRIYILCYFALVALIIRAMFCR